MIYAVLFVFGAAGYSILEILWRGFTHWSMMLAGGISLCSVYVINERFLSCNIFFRCFLCSTAITLIELIFGIVFNLLLKKNVWDYSYMPLNFMGQICFTYSFLWYILSFALLYICTALKHLYI